MTVREFISSVRNELNTITLDDRISNRFIFSKMISYADIIIKRESDSRRLFNSTNLFKVDNCFELKEEQILNCSSISIPKCKTVMRSKKVLEDFYSSIYGNLLIVSTLDESNRFEQTTPENYKNILNREFKPKTGYYWINNGYLIIPDSEVEVVKLRYIPKLSIKSGLDSDIGIPSWLVADILRMVVTDIRNTKQIVKDENPDMNSNSK